MERGCLMMSDGSKDRVRLWYAHSARSCVCRVMLVAGALAVTPVPVMAQPPSSGSSLDQAELVNLPTDASRAMAAQASAPSVKPASHGGGASNLDLGVGAGTGGSALTGRAARGGASLHAASAPAGVALASAPSGMTVQKLSSSPSAAAAGAAES